MAPKAPDTLSPPEIDQSTAIRLLTTQLEMGVRLLKARPLTEDNHARWELNTRHHLAKAFGRGSPLILRVVDAGTRSTCPVDADKKWWEAYRLERLTAQATELSRALKLLGGEPTAEVPRLPKSEAPARAPKAAPKPAVQKPPPGRDAVFIDEPRSPVRPTTTRSGASASEAPDAGVAASDVFEGWPSEPPSAAVEPLPAAVPPPAPAKAASAAPPAQSTAPVDYFTGVACLNGHAVTGAAEAYPARATPRCKTCGIATLRACRECGVGLRGGQYSMRLDDRAEPPWAVPNYCHSCGAAFPWTRIKRDAIEATIAELQELEAAEREGLLALVPDTIADTPKTAVAVLRWQRAFSKLAGQTRSLVTDVLKQAAAPLVAQHLGLTS
jgi:hypothetical protein